MGDSAISAWERGSSLLEKLMCDCLVRPMSLQVVEDGFTPRAPTTVMRPDGEAPLAAADEIGVEVGDTEVVDGGKLLDVDHLLDDDPGAGRRSSTPAPATNPSLAPRTGEPTS